MHSLITLLIMETIPAGSNPNKEVVILSHGFKAAIHHFLEGGSPLCQGKFDWVHQARQVWLIQSCQFRHRRVHGDRNMGLQHFRQCHIMKPSVEWKMALNYYLQRSGNGGLCLSQLSFASYVSNSEISVTRWWLMSNHVNL